MSRLTFIVTVDGIKERNLLNLLIHSLNLQTCKDFEVVFYNQTKLSDQALFAVMAMQPQFPYTVYRIPDRDWLGEYPLWDLYALHSYLLDESLLHDFFISLHMEEFLSPTYVEDVRDVLNRHRFDILFGNMRRLNCSYEELMPLLSTRDSAQFSEALERLGVTSAPHWSLTHTLSERAGLPEHAGYSRLPRYVEDVYLMRRDFAVKTNWFLSGHSLYLEDIHICDKPGVCELGAVLQQAIEFPLYFNKGSIYHVPHRKYYYAIADREFSARLLQLETRDPGLRALQHAARLYHDRHATLNEALQYSRRNAEGTGTQNLNWRYHYTYLRPIFPNVDWSRYERLSVIQSCSTR